MYVCMSINLTMQFIESWSLPTWLIPLSLLPRSYGSAGYFISTHTHMEKEGAITQHDSACIYVHMYSRRIRDGDFAYIRKGNRMATASDCSVICESFPAGCTVSIGKGRG